MISWLTGRGAAMPKARSRQRDDPPGHWLFSRTKFLDAVKVKPICELAPSSSAMRSALISSSFSHMPPDAKLCHNCDRNHKRHHAIPVGRLLN